MPPGRQALFFVGVAFCLLYFALGVLFLFVKTLPFNMTPLLRTSFGVVLVAYAVFRLTRLFGELKES